MSSELLSSKVVVVEEAPSVRGLPSLPTSVAGAIGLTERGPVGVPVLCTTFAEFQATFGGFVSDAMLPFAVLGFFENGGRFLHVVKTVHNENLDEAQSGLHSFDTVQDMSLLFAPDSATPDAQEAIVRYCEIDRQGTVFAILDPPANHSAMQMVAYVQDDAKLLGSSEYAAIFWPRVQIRNPAAWNDGELLVVPPSGAIAGVFARCDAARPGGVYDPPAGIARGRLFGIASFETNEVLNEAKRDIIYPKRINPLTTGPGLPRFIDGSRTLKGDGNFAFISERRGVMFIEQTLRQGLQFARHQNNTEELRAQVRRTVKAFLLQQMQQGAFQSRDPDKAFFVDVSDDLNTASMVAAGKLLVRVGLATNKPAEFIVLSISADTRSLQSELAQ